MLTRRDDRLWTYEEPLRFLGIEIGRIMSVMKLSSGGLFIHSPAQLTPRLKSELDRLGPVRFVASASKLHGHLYMEQYREAYPDAELLAAPGLASRRPELRFDQVLGETPDPRWRPDIDQVAIAGHRWLTEIAFLHRPSRTLILADLGFHIGKTWPLSTRLIARALRMYKQVSPPLEIRLTITTEATFRRAVQDLLAWELDRVIPGHGESIDSGGKAAVIEGYEWLLE